MPDLSPVRRAVLRHGLRALLAFLEAQGHEPLSVESTAEGWRVLVRIEPAGAGPALTPAPDTPLPPPLRRVHRRLLEVCTARPQTGKRLAALAGYARANSYVRGALTELVRAGRLVRTADGYRRA